MMSVPLEIAVYDDSSAEQQRRFGGLDRLYGLEGAARIRAAHVAVVGIGGGTTGIDILQDGKLICVADELSRGTFQPDGCRNLQISRQSLCGAICGHYDYCYYLFNALYC